MKLLGKHKTKTTASLSASEKRVIDKAVKKTVKDYKKTLDLLAKT
jgi:hypothetical protein